MKTKNFFLVFLVLFATLSCSEENLIEIGLSDEIIEAVDGSDRNEFKFARILSEAIADCEELRTLIKTESLKKFDNDHDVLYQHIREHSVDGLKVHELLAQYAAGEEEFEAIEHSMPLLTILVPTLPDFSPETWNTGEEIPLVAVRMEDGLGTPVFEHGSAAFTIPEHLIPGYPILVVKQNERIRLASNSSLKSGCVKTGNHSFEFIDEAFNGFLQKEKSIVIAKDEVPQHIIDAYHSGVDWHRDHIYYGLTKSNDKGAFKSEYSEYLTSFRFTGDRWYQRIADQDEDPVITSADMWTDGAFEFKVIVYNNAKNGLGSVYVNHFTAAGFEIMEPSYTKTYGPRGRRSKGTVKHYYKINKMEGKAFNPNVEIVPWDLSEYSIAWKLSVSEEDDSQEITQTQEVTSEYASNFEISAGIEKKIGFKFGSSSTETIKSTYSVKTKMDSDELGDAALFFRDPIIVSESATNDRTGRGNGSRGGSRVLKGYRINEISVSNDLFLVVMPMKKN